MNLSLNTRALQTIRWILLCHNNLIRWMSNGKMYEWLHCCWTHLEGFESPLHSDIKGSLCIRLLWCWALSISIMLTLSCEWAEPCIQIWTQSNIYVWISQPTRTVKKLQCIQTQWRSLKSFSPIRIKLHFSPFPPHSTHADTTCMYTHWNACLQNQKRME